MPRVLGAFVLAVALEGQTPPIPAAPQQPAFRSGTQVVEVDIRVFDREGHFVTDVRPEDVELTEDGAPQKIQSLTLVGAAAPSAPSALLTPSTTSPASRPSPPPAASSASPTPSASAPSVWIFVFDTNNLSAGPLNRARDAVALFIKDKFHEGTIGGLVVDGKMANNRLTTDREELLKGVQAVRMPGNVQSRRLEMTREWPRLQDEFEAFRIAVDNDSQVLQQVVVRACSEDRVACSRGPADVQVREKARQVVNAARQSTLLTLSVVQALSNGLARMAGPKTIVFFSEGFVVEHQEAELQQAEGQANRAGAHFYTIDARGLNRGGASSDLIDQPHAPGNVGANPAFDVQADGTNSLAVDTGGLAIRNENNFGRALDTIQRDAGTYYVLGYSPANQTFDGKYRAIGVKVNRPGVKVRARRGYLAMEPAKMLVPRPITKSATPDPSSDTAPSAPVASALSVPSSPSAASSAPFSAPPTPAPSAAAPLTPSALSAPSAPSAPSTPSAPSSAVRPTVDAGRMLLDLGRRDDAGAHDDASQGWAAYQRGDVEAASTYLSTAALSAEARPWVHYALGLSQFALQKYKEAAVAWEHVRATTPEFEPAYFNLADAYLLQHDESGAIKVLRDAERRWPADEEVYNAIGVLQIRRGALDAAIESFRQAIQVSPTVSLGYFNLARTHQMRHQKAQRYDRQMEKWVGGEEDRKKAVENFEKYIELGGPYVQQAKDALEALSWRT